MPLSHLFCLPTSAQCNWWQRRNKADLNQTHWSNSSQYTMQRYIIHKSQYSLMITSSKPIFQNLLQYFESLDKSLLRGGQDSTQSTYMKRELKIAPLKVYFFFTAFNNSKQGFQRHRKVFLWGIYAAPTSGAVQTQAHLALCSLGAADKLLLTSPYFQTISEILCHSPSMPRN